MADTLSIISIVTFVLAAVFFTISLILWFVLKIPKTIGDFNMRNARKSIAKMRKESEEKNSNNSEIRGKKKGAYVPETGLMNENKADVGTVKMIQDKTEIMGSKEAEILDSEVINARREIRQKVGFKVIDEVILVHTDEVVT